MTCGIIANFESAIINEEVRSKILTSDQALEDGELIEFMEILEGEF